MEREEKALPKRNDRFRLSDFFQTEVDEFHSGDFLFLSAKKVKTKTSDALMELIDSCDEYGWIISTYCYTNKWYYKIFVCEYKQKPWMNHYHIEAELSGINGCDGYSVNSTIDDFIDWMQYSVPQLIEEGVLRLKEK